MSIYLKNIKSVFCIPHISSGDSLLIRDDGMIEKNPKRVVDAKTIDCSSLCLSPGWIDLHTHIYEGVCDIGLNPALLGPNQSVTHILDAGSSGYVTYPGLKKYLIDSSEFDIKVFLNLGAIGITKCNKICDYEGDAFIDIDSTIKCIEENRDIIKGVKVRACKVVLKGKGIEVVKDAAKVAKETNLPLMVHIGDAPPLLNEIIDELKEGDIITHCFNGKKYNIINPNTGKIFDYVWDAKKRGILFDIGHGGASFNFKIAKIAMSEGFYPDFVSTDLHTQSINIIKNQANVLDKVFSCGMDLESALYAVSRTPRKILGLQDFNGDFNSYPIDFSLFKIEEGSKILIDAQKNTLESRINVIPYGAIYKFKENIYDKTHDI